jgi:hypothetical protein
LCVTGEGKKECFEQIEIQSLGAVPARSFFFFSLARVFFFKSFFIVT